MAPGVIRRTIAHGDKTSLHELHIAKDAVAPLHTRQIGYVGVGRQSGWRGLRGRAEGLAAMEIEVDVLDAFVRAQREKVSQAAVKDCGAEYRVAARLPVYTGRHVYRGVDGGDACQGRAG